MEGDTGRSGEEIVGDICWIAGELFSLSFYGNERKHRMLVDLPKISGKLWDLYEVMGDEFFRPVDDYTDDIDSPEGYQKWCEALKQYVERGQ